MYMGVRALNMGFTWDVHGGQGSVHGMYMGCTWDVHGGQGSEPQTGVRALNPSNLGFTQHPPTYEIVNQNVNPTKVDPCTGEM